MHKTKNRLHKHVQTSRAFTIIQPLYLVTYKVIAQHKLWCSTSGRGGSNSLVLQHSMLSAICSRLPACKPRGYGINNKRTSHIQLSRELQHVTTDAAISSIGVSACFAARAATISQASAAPPLLTSA
jgi:hypothetical protein